MNPQSAIRNPQFLSDPALRTFLFWTAPSAGWSRIIVRITGRQLPDRSDRWSHMGLGFTLSSGRMIYYEALHHYGFTGPHDINKLFSFEKSGGNLAIEFTAINAPASDQILRRCEMWTHYKSYHALQLVLMWAWERFGRHIPRSPGRVVCSEAATALIWPHLDLRDPAHPDFDYVNPNSAWRAWQKLKASATKN